MLGLDFPEEDGGGCERGNCVVEVRQKLFLARGESFLPRDLTGAKHLIGKVVLGGYFRGTTSEAIKVFPEENWGACLPLKEETKGKGGMRRSRRGAIATLRLLSMGD